MKSLFKEVDNSQLVLFRIVFGILMAFYGVKSMISGWVHHVYILPKFTFNFIGFDFLQVFVGPQMYIVYTLYSLAALCVALGYRYRFSIILFTILWSVVYFIQKEHYNNHHYLILIVSIILCFSNAHKWYSLDVKQGRTKAKGTTSNFYIVLFKLLIAVVFFYAAIAKIYPDWLNAIPMQRWLSFHEYNAVLWSDNFALKLKSFFSQSRIHYFFSYAGIFFDLLVIPAFLWKRTRTIALVASLMFHLTNAYLFKIGIFPFFALSFVVFFYPAEQIRKLFFKHKPIVHNLKNEFRPSTITTMFLCTLICFQIVYPLHHHIIPGDVLWTEGGHRHSWRMMLRMKTADCQVFAVHPIEERYEEINLSTYLLPCQIKAMGYRPDFQWQFAKKMEKIYMEKWDIDEVPISMYAMVGVNGRKKSVFTNKQYDVSSWKWCYFKLPPWLEDKPF